MDKSIPNQPNQMMRRAMLAFIGLNAAGVAIFGFPKPKAIDKAFTWADLPPLHARFIAALYLFGAILLFTAAAARRRSTWWPALIGTLIFTSSMGLLTALNSKAFNWPQLAVVIWVLAYTTFPAVSLATIYLYRRRDPADTGGKPLAKGLVVALQVLSVVFGVIGLGLLFFRETMADNWPWKVSNGVAQFYFGPFVTIAWCCWAYSRRAVRDITGFVVAMFALGASVIAISVHHRNLFDAARPVTWLWFGVFGAITVGFAWLCLSLATTRSPVTKAVAHAA